MQNSKPILELVTGAKTPIGKAKSSQNAYKHGMNRLIRELRGVLREQRDVLSKKLDGLPSTNQY